MEVQVVDGCGDFVGAFDQEFRRSDYVGVVAVIGGQSSGKSTLLNEAFGTQFPVLDASRMGRVQTTVGIWCGLRQGVVLLDVEGADSRERGEGQRKFEAATALVSISIADVVFVNVWFHDIGRYEGANYGLFQVLWLEVIRMRRLRRLRRGEGKIHLVVVIRDCDDEVDEIEVSGVMRRDLESLWCQLRGAQGGDELGDLEDSIQLFFIPLSHYKYARNEFVKDTKRVRSQVRASIHQVREENGDDPDERFPLSLFEATFKSLWDQIWHSEEAQLSSLPRYNELTARYRINQCSRRAFSHSMPGIDDLRKRVLDAWDAPLGSFGEDVAGIAESAFEHYTSASKRFLLSRADSTGEKELAGILLLGQATLGEKLYSELGPILGAQLASLQRHEMDKFDEAFLPLLGGTREFSKESRSLERKHTRQFSDAANKCKLPDWLKAQPSHAPHEEVNNAIQSFKVSIQSKIQERNMLGELMLPQDGMYSDSSEQSPPWWKQLLMQVVGAGLNIGANWLLMKLFGGSRQDAIELQRNMDKRRPHAPSF